jgi:hypothetical protein
MTNHACQEFVMLGRVPGIHTLPTRRITGADLDTNIQPRLCELTGPRERASDARLRDGVRRNCSEEVGAEWQSERRADERLFLLVYSGISQM